MVNQNLKHAANSIQLIATQAIKSIEALYAQIPPDSPQYTSPDEDVFINLSEPTFKEITPREERAEEIEPNLNESLSSRPPSIDEDIPGTL